MSRPAHVNPATGGRGIARASGHGLDTAPRTLLCPVESQAPSSRARTRLAYRLPLARVDRTVPHRTVRAVPLSPCLPCLPCVPCVPCVPCRSIRSVQAGTWDGTVAPAGPQVRSDALVGKRVERDRVGDEEARRHWGNRAKAMEAELRLARLVWTHASMHDGWDGTHERGTQGGVSQRACERVEKRGLEPRAWSLASRCLPFWVPIPLGPSTATDLL